MIGQVVSHYRVIEKIGAGGMGEVYLAEDTELNRKVALKFLPSESSSDTDRVQRFKREARAAAALNHPNIVTIYEVSEHDGRPFIAMEFVAGETLREHARSAERPLPELVNLLTQVAAGLAEAHRAGVVHRDLKPENVVIDGAGRARILDFGLAQLRGASRLTREKSTLGTTHYMSPEQARGDAVDHRSDIFSLGVMLYELTTGQLPFRGEHEQAVIYSILNEDPRPVSESRPDSPRELHRTIHKALAKNPQDRYQSVDDLLGDLGTERRVRTRRNPRLRVYLGIPAAVLIVGAAWYVWQISGARRSAQDMQSVRPSPISLRQVTFSEDLEEYPAFSPDGAKIAYSRETSGFKKIYIKDLTTGEVRQLTEGDRDDIQPTWSPAATRILFVRSNQPGGKLEPGIVYGVFGGGDVWSVNIASRQTRRVVEQAFNPAFSPDGKHIAFDASLAGTRRIWVTDERGRNSHQVSFDSSEGVRHVLPKWAPDGARIVFQRVERTKFDIEVVDIGKKVQHSVTDDLYQNTNPVWHPGGDTIYFSSYRGGGRNIWRVAVSPEGTPTAVPEQVTTGAGEDVQLAVAPDGSRLAFSILKINADVWRLPVSPETGRPTGEPERVVATTREDSRAAWSPDGRTITFNSDRTGDMNIWLHDLETGADRQLTQGPGGDYQPNWSPDGIHVAFFSSRSGNADIWVVDAATGDLRQLTDDASLDFNPFFSPDGKQIAFHSERFGRVEVWVMNADGSDQRALTNIGARGHFSRWSAAGTSIVFRTLADPNADAYSVPAAGGEPRPLVDVMGGAHMSFSPDHSLILDVVGHKVLWVTPVDSGPPEAVFQFAEPDIRIDYPVWSPDGQWVLFDRLKPQGGDIWFVENLP